MPRTSAHAIATYTTNTSLRRAVNILCASDSALAAAVQRFGHPPLWDREPGYATLVHIILEQQVSLASALAALNKLKALVGTITPEAVLSLSDAQLLAAGFSRQKARYSRLLAEAILSGAFAPEALTHLPDDAARAALMALTGIGVWSADIYLLMVLCRADIWPRGDLALLIGAQEVLNLNARPGADEFAELGERWRPHRSAAARILWHHYLGVRRRA
jgi:DNA-3-methyladenine glycosylase II